MIPGMLQRIVRRGETMLGPPAQPAVRWVRCNTLLHRLPMLPTNEFPVATKLLNAFRWYSTAHSLQLHEACTGCTSECHRYFTGPGQLQLTFPLNRFEQDMRRKLYVCTTRHELGKGARAVLPAHRNWESSGLEGWYQPRRSVPPSHLECSCSRALRM